MKTNRFYTTNLLFKTQTNRTHIYYACKSLFFGWVGWNRSLRHRKIENILMLIIIVMMIMIIIIMLLITMMIIKIIIMIIIIENSNDNSNL